MLDAESGVLSQDLVTSLHLLGFIEFRTRIGIWVHAVATDEARFDVLGC